MTCLSCLTRHYKSVPVALIPSIPEAGPGDGRTRERPRGQAGRPGDTSVFVIPMPPSRAAPKGLGQMVQIPHLMLTESMDRGGGKAGPGRRLRCPACAAVCFFTAFRPGPLHEVGYHG